MKHITIITILLFTCLWLFADGLIVVDHDEYPSVCLKNKVTDINVDINGLVAETVVYQEFENEWTDTVNGVFVFPLPPEARTTRLQYTFRDTLVDAVLKVQQQSTTPGTGEGGIIAEINAYMGNNVLRLALKKIAPQEIKSIRLSYIALLKQYNGNYEYNYPLNTSDYVKHPLDYLRIRVKVNSSKPITGFDLISHSDYQIRSEENNLVEVEYLKSKAYLAKDITFIYSVENSPFAVDLFTWKPDSNDGFFTMIGRPQIESADSTIPHKIIFLLGNSTTMIGNKINQSKSAISLALETLSVTDSFNILVFNASVSGWKSNPVPAISANISDANTFLDEISVQSGNRLDIGIYTALSQLKSSNTLSSILAFTDGKSPVDPYEVAELNTNKTSISFVAIGNNIDRVRLEALAMNNFGFITYVNENNILSSEMVNIFNKIRNPILKEVDCQFSDPEVDSLYPFKFPPIYAGNDFLITGMYKKPGIADIIIEGRNYIENDLSIRFQKEFSHNHELSRKIWAKYAIDDLESQILIYGESEDLKNKLIELSLKHNIRCRYTAFTEDETIYSEYTDTEPDTEWPSAVESFNSNTPEEEILSNYPNPFSELTIIKVFIDDNDIDCQKFIEFYDINGRLIKMLNISHLGEGFHEIKILRSELGYLVNGTIIVRLKVNNTVKAAIKIITFD